MSTSRLLGVRRICGVYEAAWPMEGRLSVRLDDRCACREWLVWKSLPLPRKQIELDEFVAKDYNEIQHSERTSKNKSVQRTPHTSNTHQCLFNEICKQASCDQIAKCKFKRISRARHTHDKWLLQITATAPIAGSKFIVVHRIHRSSNCACARHSDANVWKLKLVNFNRKGLRSRIQRFFKLIQKKDMETATESWHQPHQSADENNSNCKSRCATAVIEKLRLCAKTETCTASRQNNGISEYRNNVCRRS